MPISRMLANQPSQNFLLDLIILSQLGKAVVTMKMVGR